MLWYLPPFVASSFIQTLSFGHCYLLEASGLYTGYETPVGPHALACFPPPPTISLNNSYLFSD